MFTRHVDAERRNLFIRILSGLAKSGLVWVVATMRNDLWHRAVETPALLALVEAGARLDLLRPDGAEVIEIIRRPAAVAGLAFEKDSESGIGLDAVVARAASEEPGVLPLLSVLLETLYERDIAAAKADASHSNVLTFATYRSLGELKGAIAQRADQALGRLRQSDPEAAAAFPQVLRTLITVSQSGDAITSRPAPLDSFAEGSPQARLIAAFLAPDARLLVASAAAGGAEVRLAHEALLENWPAAKQQVQTDRRDLETRARIEALHHRWSEATSAADKKRALLRGLNLAEGADLAARWSVAPGSELGAFVKTSARAERLRRSWFAASAAALVLIFGAIAAVAGLESRRAEREASSARQAESAERNARDNAEQQSAEAVRQRDRADRERRGAVESEKKAVEALRETKRESARTLASQADLAVSRHEVRRGLRLAVKAGETEQGTLDPGTPSLSEPVLLKTMGEARQELHVQRPHGGVAMPYDTFGDNMLVHADPAHGLVITELSDPPRVVAHTVLPEKLLPMRVRSLVSAGLVVVSGVRTILLVDVRSGAITASFDIGSRVTAIDVHEGKRQVAIATTTSLYTLDVASKALSEPIAVGVPEKEAIGQVRFDRAGEKLLFSVGTKIQTYDLAAHAVVEGIKAELDASSAGIDQKLLASVLENALIVVVELIPDLTRDRLLTEHIDELKAWDAKGARVFERDDKTLRYAGLSFTDQAGKGELQEAIAVLIRTSDTEQEIQLRYVSDDDAKMYTLERLTVPREDVSGEKLSTCKVSLRVSHLICEYTGASADGLVAFRLLGGAHRFERVAARPRTNFAGFLGDPSQLLLAEGSAIIKSDKSVETKVGELPAGWLPVMVKGHYMVAASVQEQQVGVWRVNGDERGIVPVVKPMPGRVFDLDAAGRYAVLADGQRLLVFSLEDGRQLAQVPGFDGLSDVVMAADGSRLAALTKTGVFVFQTASGRLELSLPISRKEGLYAFDPKLTRLAYLDEGGALRIAALAGGEPVTVDLKGRMPSVLAWVSQDGPLTVGFRDGGVEAFTADGGARWSIGSPLGRAFSENNAWPGQPPKGLVLSLMPSADGKTLAVIRQDLGSVDLHDAASGRLRTHLTSPGAFGTPSRVELMGDRILTSWAPHAMLHDKPNYMTLHQLPTDDAALLAAATERLRRLDAVWSPAGPPPT